MLLSTNRNHIQSWAKLSLFILSLLIVSISAFIILKMPYLMDTSAVIIVASLMLAYCTRLVEFYQPHH